LWLWGKLLNMTDTNMTDTNYTIRQSSPSKCRLCDKPTSDVVVCDYCHAINPSSLSSDYFSLLGLERKFNIDPALLQQKFFALSRHVHPDRHSGDTPEVQQLALAMAAAVNDAYRTLKDPADRGAYLLELSGGKSSAADKSVPDGLLETTMMMQEELADAKAAGRAEDVAHLRVVLKNQQEGLIQRIAELFGQYEESAACEAVRSELLKEIRQQLNAVSYVKKLLSQVG
jgi:molecular chaperone HscB